MIKFCFVVIILAVILTVFFDIDDNQDNLGTN